MKNITECFRNLKNRITPQSKTAFITALVVGLLTHLTVMVSDFPNHDGLYSMYFDQNMITSGRWFLGAACGISTYFTIPWIIGVLSLIYLAVASALCVSVLEVKNKLTAGIIGALMVAFPAVASTFAYVFTMDGYMIGLILAILCVWITKQSKWSFILGGICMAFSLGIYQAYLPVTIVLCMYSVVLVMAEKGGIKSKFFKCLRFLFMGIIGAGLYYILLNILLKIQGKVLDTYQGIDGLDGGMSIGKILQTIPAMIKDFVSFTLTSRVFIPNIFALIAFIVLACIFIVVFIGIVKERRWYKSAWLYITLILFIVVLPIAMNVVLLISAGVKYHLIMRYQWVLIPILMIAFIDSFGNVFAVSAEKKTARNMASWALAIASVVIILCYALADNVGYSNLSKKYEKTYAYCERLLDRMEQTEGYYQGIPVAIMGVIGSDPYPTTDITEKVTGNMIGLSGDFLVYKNADYQSFMSNYLGATINFLPIEDVAVIYYSDEYKEMESFPGKTSTKVVDGVLYVKTENLNLED